VNRPALAAGLRAPGNAAHRVRGFCWGLGLLAASAGSPAAEFNIDSLSELVRTRSVQTLEQALAALPAPLRENFTLVFASRSLQGASPAAPRVILYGVDGRFVVTFNGDAGERGFDALETMQFDERSNSFHFREVTFSAATGGGTISDDNPPRCVVCHGRPARPIWDSLPSWPGVYGERYRAGLSKPEATGMESFLARQAQDPRYGQLIGARRFGDRATYVASSAARYDGASVEPPNARLTVLLATLNVRSLAADLSEQPPFAAHRYALLAAAAGNCGDLKAFFPAAARAAFVQALAEFERSTAGSSVGLEAAKQLRRVNHGDGYRAGTANVDSVMLRFIAERLVGMPRQRWSMAFEGSLRDLAVPEGSLSLEQLLFERLAGGEPELRDLRTFRSFTATDPYCAELGRRSERALAAFYGAGGVERMLAAVPAAAFDAGARPPLLEHCVRCHSGDVGPALPFADPDALGSLLKAGGYPHGRLLDEVLYRLAPQAGAARMPRGVNLTPSEQRELEDYFVNLAAR
jgi:hypothetical protein